jgi:uncharacterized membrane protein HdeD (DUF308 family)
VNIQAAIEKHVNAIEQEIARSWWVFGLSGLISALFGLAAIFLPLDTLRALMYAFGAFTLINGGFALVASVYAAQARAPWWPLALAGVTGIVAGILTLVWPEVTALALLYIIAFWAIVSGVFSIIAAIRLRKLIRREWLLALGGAVSVLFGLGLIVFPGDGAVAIVSVIGAFQFAVGVVTMASSIDLFLLNRQNRDPREDTTRPVLEGRHSPAA